MSSQRKDRWSSSVAKQRYLARRLPAMSAFPSASDAFRAACDSIWRALHEHPFITELAVGTLPLETFRFFLEQDNFYLEEYARCLAMGAAKSRNEAELRYFTTDLNQVLDAELPSNRTLLARVTEMGAADRGGALGDGAGQRRVHELHALARAARRSPRDHGVAPPLRVELRRDRRRPAGTHRPRTPCLRRTGSPTSASRRTSRWSDRCAGTSTPWWPRRSPPMPGATTSAGSSPRAPGWSASFWDMAYTLERWPDLAEP